MVATYALLSIPMAYTLTILFALNWLLYIAAGLLVFFMDLNVFQTYQFSLGILWTEGMNQNYYKAMFGKTAMTKQDLIICDSGEPEPKEADLQLVKTLYVNDSEDSLAVNTILDNKGNNTKVFELPPAIPFSPAYYGIADTVGIQPNNWDAIEFWVKAPKKLQTGDYFKT